MNVEKIWVDGLEIGPRMRAVDQTKVDALAASMQVLGLRQPISVWADGNHGVHLVAGLHRVKAAEKLGWETIDAIVVDLNDIDRRRWEIAENLHRSELKVLERDQHVAEWIRLTEEVDVLSQSATKPKSSPKGGRPKAGVRKAAEELGIDKDDAHRAVKVASLTDEAKETAKEIGLDDNRSALLKAAKSETAEGQVATLKQIAARPRRKSHDDDVSWTEDGQPSREQLISIRELDDAELCAFLLRVESVGLIPALKVFTRAA